MKKTLYVGNLKFDHVVDSKTNKYRYKYLPITEFLKKAESLGLNIIDWEYDKTAFISQTKFVYKVTFQYKFRDRKMFKANLMRLADSYIMQYFVMKDKLNV